MVPVLLGFRGWGDISGLGTLLGVQVTSAWTWSDTVCQASHLIMWVSVPWLWKETSFEEVSSIDSKRKSTMTFTDQASPTPSSGA